MCNCKITGVKRISHGHFLFIYLFIITPNYAKHYVVKVHAISQELIRYIQQENLQRNKT